MKNMIKTFADLTDLLTATAPFVHYPLKTTNKILLWVEPSDRADPCVNQVFIIQIKVRFWSFDLNIHTQTNPHLLKHNNNNRKMLKKITKILIPIPFNKKNYIIVSFSFYVSFSCKLATLSLVLLWRPLEEARHMWKTTASYLPTQTHSNVLTFRFLPRSTAHRVSSFCPTVLRKSDSDTGSVVCESQRHPSPRVIARS